nr:hypothetical protein [Streptomyces sp. S3(2020)]
MHRREFAAVVDDRAVWSPLLGISGSLETQLPSVFDASYGERLEAARRRLIGELGDLGESPGRCSS